jgi:hypothetical protein
MKTQDYSAVISINASPAQAFNCISSVTEWWTGNVEGNSKKKGDVFTVHFGDTFVAFEVTEAAKGKIGWVVTDCYLHWLKEKKEWNNTKIVFDISEQNGATQINMTHIGLVPGIECYGTCEEGWDHYIKKSLFKLITEGKGIPERIKTE